MAHADAHGANAIGLWVRRKLTELVETIERSKVLYSKLGATWHDQEKMWRFPNGARLRFAYLERDTDAESYQGHSYTRLYVEEIGNFPNARPIMLLMATLRSAAGVPCRVIATGNPGGPGQGWIAERYIDPAPLGWEILKSTFTDPWTGESIERTRVYIPSRVKDNKYLGADYIAGLYAIDDDMLVNAWLHGDFSVIVGAYFKGFRRCIIEPFTIPTSWPRCRSFDWGSAKPFGVGWWAISDGSIPPYRVGELIRYREWYGAKSANVGLELTDDEIFKGIREREGKDEHFIYSVADPSIFGKRKTGTGKSTAEVAAEHGVVFRLADNDRVAGWRQLRNRLKGMDDQPMVRCFSTCIDSIRTIPMLQHDTIKPEDVDSDGDDHLADEWRYFCMSRPWAPVVKPIDEVKLAYEQTVSPVFAQHLKRRAARRAGLR